MRIITSLLIFFAIAFAGCQSVPTPIHTMESVDLHRFMGAWYVIANIPTFIEEGAHNAVETYTLRPDGRIATTFSFRQNAFDGAEQRYHPTGFVIDPKTNAIWEMEFFWPFRSDYRILYVSEDYGATVIGRNARDFVWIMARQPEISEAELQKLISVATREGYDPRRIQRVPQHWK